MTCSVKKDKYVYMSRKAKHMNMIIDCSWIRRIFNTNCGHLSWIWVEKNNLNNTYWKKLQILNWKKTWLLSIYNFGCCILTLNIRITKEHNKNCLKIFILIAYKRFCTFSRLCSFKSINILLRIKLIQLTFWFLDFF